MDQALPVYSDLAPAKVNLHLHVGPVKSNGRHDLDSLVVFADASAADRVSVRPADKLSLEVTGPGAACVGPASENLVIRAALALQALSGCTDGASIRLEKMLPVAAGIGGGSSDAAATLRLLTRMWGLSPELACQVAPTLGGDVPVALSGRPALMQGEGERVTGLAFPWRLPALLVNPGKPCPTGPVFAAYDRACAGAALPETRAVPDFSAPGALIGWLEARRNDLEAPAIVLVPEIRDILDALKACPGARLARMSGSGATCFALFDTIEQASQAHRLIDRLAPAGGWWCASCLLGGAP